MSDENANDNCNNNNIIIGEHLTVQFSEKEVERRGAVTEGEDAGRSRLDENLNLNDDLNWDGNGEGKATAEGDMAVMNYVYDSVLVETSLICDFGFRNMESLDELSQEDIFKLAEKTYTKLSLTHNGLRKIPLGFLRKYPRLEMLLVLDLSCNQLEYLPNDIGYLKNLTYLNLFLNKLRCLPSSLGNLSNLRWLNLNKNPDLFKTSYFRILAGPMSNDKECFTCAKNVVLWVNQVNDRRTNALRYECLGHEIKPMRDSHLVQDGPSQENEERLPQESCSKLKTFSCCCLVLTGAMAIITTVVYYFFSFYPNFNVSFTG